MGKDTQLCRSQIETRGQCKYDFYIALCSSPISPPAALYLHGEKIFSVPSLPGCLIFVRWLKWEQEINLKKQYFVDVLLVLLGEGAGGANGETKTKNKIGSTLH